MYPFCCCNCNFCLIFKLILHVSSILFSHYFFLNFSFQNRDLLNFCWFFFFFSISTTDMLCITTKHRRNKYNNKTAYKNKPTSPLRFEHFHETDMKWWNPNHRSWPIATTTRKAMLPFPFIHAALYLFNAQALERAQYCPLLSFVYSFDHIRQCVCVKAKFFCSCLFDILLWR